MSPEIAVIISSFERPWHLQMTLASIAAQQKVLDKIEVIVADDGSRDETPQVVRRFAKKAPFPVQFVTHEHCGFHLTRCRNEGAKVASAPYLLFLDCDCVLPPGHLAAHLAYRRPGWALGTECYRLDQKTTARFTEDVVRTGQFVRWRPLAQYWALNWRALKCLFYRAIRHRRRPKIYGGNFALWRKDFEAVNGFDENFRNWGCEDDDLRLRLQRLGVRTGSLLHVTRTYHLWHPPHESAPTRWSDGQNVAYLNRPVRLTRCMNGLVKRKPEDLQIAIVGRVPEPQKARAVLGSFWPSEQHQVAEVEVLFYPGCGSFTGKADCNILVLLADCKPPIRLLRKTHVLLSDKVPEELAAAVSIPYRFSLGQFQEALSVICGQQQCNESKTFVPGLV